MSHTSRFFIVGCPRSGTTLVQRLLSTHPESTVLPETFFIRRLMPKGRALCDPLLPDEHDAVVQAVLCSDAWAVQSLEPAALYEAVRIQPQTGAGILRAWMQATARVHEARLVGEKTPDHALHVGALHAAFPKARFLHVVRDPRAVVTSWQSVPWSSGYSWRDADLWRARVQAVRQAPGSIPVHTIRFETLVQDPTATMQRVAAFLGLARGHTWEQTTDVTNVAVDTEAEPWKANALAPIDASVASRWRSKLKAEDWAMVEAVTHYEMMRWGYMPEASYSDRTAAAWRYWNQRVQWKAERIVEAYDFGT